jgi:hypothetical protein
VQAFEEPFTDRRSQQQTISKQQTNMLYDMPAVIYSSKHDLHISPLAAFTSPQKAFYEV